MTWKQLECARNSCFRGEGGVRVDAHLEADPADGIINVAIELSGVIGENSLSPDDACDGGGGQADRTQHTSELVEVSRGVGGFDEATSEDADESDLFSETLNVCGFDAREVAFFEATRVEAVLEGVHVTEWGTWTAIVGHNKSLER